MDITLAHDHSVPQVSAKSRLISIDALRGMIMVLMALDHVRDFWSAKPFSATDVTQTSVILFATRWITHLCAPGFIFLAGISIFLYRQKAANKEEVSLFLLTRGIWMIVLETFVVNFLWQFSYSVLFLQVIWVIGWSMLGMALLIWLPRWALATFTLVLIAGHNLLSIIEPNPATAMDLAWIFMHKPAFFLKINNTLPPLFAVYQLIPWIAVMSSGYLAGTVFTKSEKTRKVQLRWIGIGLILIFVALRFMNFYGDPKIWELQDRGFIFTFLSFMNVTKYPPSLLYLCITLGTVCILLSLFEGSNNRITQVLSVFGKAPLFFYLLHIPLINGSAMVWTYFSFGHPVNFFFTPAAKWPAAYVPNLALTYIVWCILLFLLYFACRWYAGYKQAHAYWWLRYL